MDFLLYQQFLKKEYPSAYCFLKDHLWEPIFFSEPVPLSKTIYRQIEQIVKKLYQLKNKKEYQHSLVAPNISGKNLYPNISDWLKIILNNKHQDSVLMAYDFHIHNNSPQLIEVNTNASSFLLVNSLYQFKNKPYKKALEDLKQSFKQEWDKFKQPLAGSRPKKLVLIDENPLQQKMAIEFFMYKDFFKSMDWPFEICDSKSLKSDNQANLYTPKGDKIDFIYNRSTDFYFQNHPFLLTAYQKKSCVISPHPWDYYLLADKSRLYDWNLLQLPELKSLQAYLPYSALLTDKNSSLIWKNRKKYFFKILQGHGGKAVYKGSSLSRKKFNELLQLKALVQAYIPPLSFQDLAGESWKLDFRAYVYKDTIQQFTARAYQGQLTNFKKQGSGFALMNFI